MLKPIIAALVAIVSSLFPAEIHAPGIVAGSHLPLFRAEAFDYAFRAPLTARPGFTRIRIVNHGKSAHHIEVTKVADTASVRTVLHILTTQVTNVQVKDWGGPNMTLPGDSSEAIVELKRGRYTIECWINGADKLPHLMKGMISTIDVSGAPNGAPPPQEDMLLHAMDYKLDFAVAPVHGKHLVKFVNDGPQEHDVQFVMLRSGETVNDILKWAKAGLVGSPPVGVLAGGAVAIDRGETEWFPLDLRAGRYVMFCFVPDAKDEKPHLMHGMIKEFTVR